MLGIECCWPTNENEERKNCLTSENLLYTIAKSNPKIHIYEVSNVSGRSKVVHRNLLLDVSFLHVRDPRESRLVILTSLGKWMDLVAWRWSHLKSERPCGSSLTQTVPSTETLWQRRLFPS